MEEDSFYNFYPATIKPMAQVTSVLSMTEFLAKSLVGTKGKHFLWVDLMQFKFGQGKVVHYSVDVDVNSPNWNRLEEVSKMMDNLKQFVEADARKPPSERIDSVQWNVNYEDEPTEEMWEILNGLSPPEAFEISRWIFRGLPCRAFAGLSTPTERPRYTHSR